MLKKLKIKFIVINMICVGVLLFGVFIAISLMTFRAEKNVIIREIERVNDAILNERIQDAKPSFDSEHAPKITTYSMVFNEKDEITAIYQDLLQVDLDEDTKDAILKAFKHEKTDGVLHSDRLLFGKTLLAGKTSVTVASAESIYSGLDIMITITGLVLLCCFVLFLALSYMLSCIAMKPVEKTWEGQKQFVADASHDLKTPLTVILANTEIIKSRGGEKVEAVTKWLDSTKEESERMRRLVDNMLELAKSDDLSEKITLVDTNVSEICEMTALQMEPIAFEKGVIINTVISPAIILKSDADSFSRLIHILIENAIKYAPQGSEVTVILRREWREVKLSVKNSGTHISKEDLPHIFERFYRSDKARGSSGFGLGLSIAKSLCERMGGKIECESREGFGTEFSVEFNMDLATLIPNLRIKKHNS